MTNKWHAVYVGTDEWSRPVFKDGNLYFCLVETVGNNDPRLPALIESANSGQFNICYKGKKFDGEPDSPVKGVTLYLSPPPLDQAQEVPND